MQITKKNIATYNHLLRRMTPKEIVQWVLRLAKRPILTTNFGPRSASLVHLVSGAKNNIPVIWCDTGYNTLATYLFAKNMENKLGLNLLVYTPTQTAAHREAVFGGIPMPSDPKHKVFTEQVKLEPFRRAIREHQPDVWFTNIRKGQTAYRDTLDILSFSKDGILKVSPFYYWADDRIERYLAQNDLPNETNYFDPTKVLQKRECGLQLG